MERTTAADLYDQDFALWVKAQVDALREGRLSHLDVENVTEELEALAKRDRRTIQNRLLVLGAHLLKRQYQPDKASRSWDATIIEQSARIRGVLDDSPSLVREVGDFMLKVYPDARKLASAETGKPLEDFPGQPSYGFAAQWCAELELEMELFHSIGEPDLDRTAVIVNGGFALPVTWMRVTRRQPH